MKCPEVRWTREGAVQPPRQRLGGANAPVECAAVPCTQRAPGGEACADRPRPARPFGARFPPLLFPQLLPAPHGAVSGRGDLTAPAKGGGAPVAACASIGQSGSSALHPPPPERLRPPRPLHLLLQGLGAPCAARWRGFGLRQGAGPRPRGWIETLGPSAGPARGRSTLLLDR